MYLEYFEVRIFDMSSDKSSLKNCRSVLIYDYKAQKLKLESKQMGFHSHFLLIWFGWFVNFGSNLFFFTKTMVVIGLSKIEITY